MGTYLCTFLVLYALFFHFLLWAMILAHIFISCIKFAAQGFFNDRAKELH